MALKISHLFTAALMAVAFGTSGASAASDPRGVWLNDTGRGAIEIKDCAGGLCGYVVWVKEGNDAMGCGKMIIDTVKAANAGKWDGGRIYSPDRKKWYDVDLKPLDSGKLKVTGHALFLSKTMMWTRAPADLARCDAGKTAASTPQKAVTAAVAPAKAQPPVKAPEASAAAPEQKLPPVGEQVAEAAPADEESSSLSEGIDLEKGLNFGDSVSIKKLPSGKCSIKAPFVNLTVDCNRRAREEN